MSDQKITKEDLFELGFEDTGETYGFKPIYRMKVEGYYWEFQFTIGDYPESNPNCGRLGIYSPITETSAIPPDLYDKPEWTPEDHERADNYTITLPKRYYNIASHVTCKNRLKRIIEDLTYDPTRITNR